MLRTYRSNNCLCVLNPHSIFCSYSTSKGSDIEKFLNNFYSQIIDDPSIHCSDKKDKKNSTSKDTDKKDFSFNVCKISHHLKSSFLNFIWKIIIMIPFLAVFYYLCLKLSSLDIYKTLLDKTLLSLGSRYIYIILMKMGCPGVLALAIGFLVRAIFTGDTHSVGRTHVLPSLPSIFGDSWIEGTYGEASSSVPNQDEASSSILNPAPAQPEMHIPPSPAPHPVQPHYTQGPGMQPPAGSAPSHSPLILPLHQRVLAPD